MKRVCLLTGASGALGTAFCRAHAHRYEIAAVRHTRPLQVSSQLQRIVDPLSASEAADAVHAVFEISADLREDSELERIVELTLARFGRIDVVIHAAVRTQTAPIVGSKALLDNAEAQLRMNVVVPVRLAAVLARTFWLRSDSDNRTANRSWINVSSIAGVNVYPGSGQSIYAASKAGMNMLTRHMADEFRSLGVRVNAVAPNTFPRIVPTDKVIRAIHDLAEGSMTGQVVVIDRQGTRVT